MREKLFLQLASLLFITSGCATTVTNKTFSLHTGNSIQTRPKNDSCFTKHIDIVHFNGDNMELYYREIHICRTKKGRTKTEDTRLGETFPYTFENNTVIAPMAVYDTLVLKRGRLKTKYGDFMKRVRNFK